MKRIKILIMVISGILLLLLAACSLQKEAEGGGWNCRRGKKWSIPWKK